MDQSETRCHAHAFDITNADFIKMQMHTLHTYNSSSNNIAPDKISLQEHWLFNFEQPNLTAIHPDYNYPRKS